MNPEPPTQPIESPCIRNCCLNDDDICVGCYRSLLEITRWGMATEEEKAKILASVQQRKFANKKDQHFKTGGS